MILTCERTPSWRRPRNGGRYRLLANLTPPRRLLASMGRNRQVPRRSGSAIGVASEVILRETARSHPQWHQVGSRSILLQRASSALRTRETTGVIMVLEGGDLPRVADLRGPLLLSSSIRIQTTIPGPPDRGRVERLHNGLQVDASSTTASAPVAAPAVPSAAAPGAMPAAAPGVSSISDAWKNKSVVCWLVGLSSRRAI